ncbi:monovalent cation/H(+) antiporter subunit G [Streptomyces sp. TRM 70361]|uniref:monovalent cation/H(+) antiporter subunit G n=1 Tax=Streptomyces sp. TRM 70361 TaxID=3116553 RepID=UPI002E7BA9E0|nr:monovalent cation/H(+) antiporter subunit G [Streptomyces sp. TRM 70361]MEE1942085.1 monovalent cation/H(+) antiporter subunit G [Streptomyces sp. TRM 70361]
MRVLLEVFAAVLLLGGAFFCLLGAIGLVRFPDTVTRLQAGAKAQTLGLVLIMIAAALLVPAPYSALLLLIAVFQLVTAPVLGQVVGRVAYRTGAVDRRTLVVDELAGRLAPPDRDPGSSAGEPEDTTAGQDPGDGREREP